MKRLLIALGAIVTAIVTQAVQCNWGSAGIQIDGDFDSGEGNFADNYLVYIVPEATTQAAVISALTGTTDAAERTAYLSGVAKDSAVTDSDGYFQGSFDLGNATEYDAFLVILDANSIDGAGYAFITDTYSATVTTLQGKYDYDGDGWVNALNYSTKAGWTALPTTPTPGPGPDPVPEPTSGILLVLGMAGLALRRRNA